MRLLIYHVFKLVLMAMATTFLFGENAVAGGFAKDGAVQDQIDDSLNDAVSRIRNQLPQGDSLTHCIECDAEIPEKRRHAVPGVQLCIVCQETADAKQSANVGYNRRGSKDSQLR